MGVCSSQNTSESFQTRGFCQEESGDTTAAQGCPRGRVTSLRTRPDPPPERAGRRVHPAREHRRSQLQVASCLRDRPTSSHCVPVCTHSPWPSVIPTYVPKTTLPKSMNPLVHVLSLLAEKDAVGRLRRHDVVGRGLTPIRTPRSRLSSRRLWMAGSHQQEDARYRLRQLPLRQASRRRPSFQCIGFQT